MQQNNLIHYLYLINMGLLNYQKTTGIITIISGLLALACMIAGLIGVNYNFDAFADPLLILTTPGINTEAARWSMIFDMLGYYLLLLPVIYLLHDWIKNKSAWGNLITFTGLSYVLVGAIGAAILAVVWPHIITAYPGATAATQEILKANFQLVNNMVYGGMWNLLEMIFAGAWWLSYGIIFYRNKFPFMGILTIVLGVFCFADGVAGIFQLTWIHEFALNNYLFLAITWAIITGIFLLRNPLK
ncbi:MAG: hypothetical protein WDO19_14700 [Bacteroidota bacterium]